jgi:hypothetical protein
MFLIDKLGELTSMLVSIIPETGKTKNQQIIYLLFHWKSSILKSAIKPGDLCSSKVNPLIKALSEMKYAKMTFLSQSSHIKGSNSQICMYFFLKTEVQLFESAKTD